MKTIGIISNDPLLNGKRRRQLYDIACEASELVEFPIHKITMWTKSSFSARLKDFKRVRTRLESRDFAEITHFSLNSVSKAWDGKIIADDDVLRSCISVSTVPPLANAAWILRIGASDARDKLIVENMLRFGKSSIDEYGYMFTMLYEYYPFLYPSGRSGMEPVKVKEEGENMGWWGLYFERPRTMLRDVHEVNFLGSSLLDQPVFDTTLEKWILSDSGRGTLQPFNKTSMMWRPPRENIGAIREELFKAGILFYFRFFQTWEKDNKWARDFSKPFKCDGNIPEIFRANYQRIIDPTSARHIPDF